MPITSFDYLMKRTTNGYTYRSEWQYTTGASSFTTNRVYNLSSFNGMNGINTFPATNGDKTWVNCNSSSSFSIPINSPIESVETRHIFLSTAESSVPTGVPGFLTLVDLQGYWPNVSATVSTSQTLSGTPQLRYSNGVGCYLYTVITTATGATPQNMSLSYVNEAGTSNRQLPSTVSHVVSNIIGAISHSGIASFNNPTPFLPLNGADIGVQNVSNVTMSAASTGAFALCLAKPILSIPIVTTALINERDYVSQLPSLPEVKNDACLTWLYTAGSATVANTNFYGSIEFVWG